MLLPSDGSPPTTLEGSDVAMEIRISPRGDLVAATMDRERREMGLWSFPEGRFLRSFALGDQSATFIFNFSRDGERLFTSTEILSGEQLETAVRSWPVGGGEPDLLARLEIPEESVTASSRVGPTESRLSWGDGHKVRIAHLEGTTVHLASATSVEHDRTIAWQAFDERGRQLATSDTGGTIRIWSLEREPPELTHTLSGRGATAATFLQFDRSGSMLAGGGFLWDLTAPPDAEPLPIYAGCPLAFDPGNRWLATGGAGVSLWPLAHTYPQVLRGHEAGVMGVAFTPDGEQLVSTSRDGSVRVWPLRGDSGERSRILDRSEGTYAFPKGIAMAPDGSFVVIGTPQGRVAVLRLDGGPVRELGGFTDLIGGVAVGPRGRFVAAGAGAYIRKEAFTRVWDLESEEVRILDAGDGEVSKPLEFTGEGDLWIASRRKLRRWSLDGGQPRILEEIDLESPEFLSDDLCHADPDGRQVLLWEGDRLWIQNMDTYDTRELISHGSEGWSNGQCFLDSTGQIVVSSNGLGAVRVGTVTGEEPHLLLGHEGGVSIIAVSPDGRWIASGGNDKTIRLWPMPDLSKPPLHTLPREELIAKLKTLTNLRVVRDEESPTGWKLDVGPFPGWETVPTW